MVKTKGSRGGSTSGGSSGAGPSVTQPTPIECCMCGDHGIPTELFECKICKFRSQHKYCSNLYPKLETYKACNWCLAPTQDSAGKSSSSCTKKSGQTRHDHAGKSKKNPDEKMGHKGLRERTQRRKANLEIKVTKSVDEMKKVHGSSPEESLVSTRRKRIAGGGGVMVEDKKKNNVLLRKSKSKNHLGDGGGIKTRPVFKHRVRRYKLLEEISSQCSKLVS